MPDAPKPVSTTDIAADVDEKRMEEGAEFAAKSGNKTKPGPIGGEATMGATVWGGETEEESER